jgi:4-hydroxy-3-polyprenylbenzoate decarboxylase
MYSDLTDFLSDLDKRRLLARVPELVSPDLEIAAVTDRACKLPGGGPALLFEKPTGFDIATGDQPVRIERAHVPRARREDARRSRERDRRADDAADAPRHHGRAEDAADGRPAARPDAEDRQGRCVSEIVSRDGTLDLFPILKCWPDDGGKFITFPLVF